MSWKIDSLVANSAINTEVMVSIAMRPLTRSAYQRKSSGCVGMFRRLRSGQYSLITLARKAFTLRKNDITNKYRVCARGKGGGEGGKTVHKLGNVARI